MKYVSGPHQPQAIRLGLSVRGLIAVILAVCPAWTVANHTRALSESQEWAMARTMGSDMRSRASMQEGFWAESGRFGTMAELDSVFGPFEEVEARVGRARLAVDLSVENISESRYTISATVRDAPWVRATITVTPDGHDYVTSVDWIGAVERRTALITWTLALVGLGSAFLVFSKWNRGPVVRATLGSVALIVVVTWASTLTYAPPIPVFSAHVGVSLGDSVWSPWMGL